jgi:hypothetical protein
MSVSDAAGTRRARPTALARVVLTVSLAQTGNKALSAPARMREGVFAVAVAPDEERPVSTAGATRLAETADRVAVAPQLLAHGG